MNTLEQASNEDTSEKIKMHEDDIDGKKSISTDAKSIITPFPFTLTAATTQNGSMSSRNEPSEISDSQFLLAVLILRI